MYELCQGMALLEALPLAIIMKIVFHLCTADSLVLRRTHEGLHPAVLKITLIIVPSDCIVQEQSGCIS